MHFIRSLVCIYGYIANQVGGVISGILLGSAKQARYLGADGALLTPVLQLAGSTTVPGFSAAVLASGSMPEPFTHVPEDGTPTPQTMVAPAFQAPSGAATAPGVPFLKPTTNTEWLQAFSLDSPPSEEWASVITQSSSLPHWLSPMIENYASLRHLFTESTDVQGFWSVEVFDRLGISETVDREALQKWISALWPVPPPAPPTNATPTPVAAATAAPPPPASPKHVRWPLQISQQQTPKQALAQGEYTVSFTQVLVRRGSFGADACGSFDTEGLQQP